jgi:hypothetical protein
LDDSIVPNQAGQSIETTAIIASQLWLNISSTGHRVTKMRGSLVCCWSLSPSDRAHNRGWQIEVISWDAGCNRYLRHFGQQHGIYRALEPVYENITFINNKRWATPF